MKIQRSDLEFEAGNLVKVKGQRPNTTTMILLWIMFASICVALAFANWSFI